ncbi:MAG: hypothetical protein ABH886_01955 [Candidatus Desantisbacteria bacterium]
MPEQDDIFLVDTNVWYWLAYSRANLADRCPNPYQIKDYPMYIGKALSAKSRLHRCGLSLSELAHLIEKTEREIYIRSNGVLNPKEYRHNHSIERANVVAEIQTAWSQINTMSQTLDLQIDEPVTNAVLSRLSSQPLDGYDLFILEAISRADVVKIITDDGDFVTVPGIQVFTANQNVIKSAQNQEKLLQR